MKKIQYCLPYTNPNFIHHANKEGSYRSSRTYWGP